jgi:hypothetical protein
MSQVMLEEKNETSGVAYKEFTLGRVKFSRDEYYVHLEYPKGSYSIGIEKFLRCTARNVQFRFFYGSILYDEIFAFETHYGDDVDIMIGCLHPAFVASGRDYRERLSLNEACETLKSLLLDWTPEEYDPLLPPVENGLPFGKKEGGDHDAALRHHRPNPERMVGLPGDEALRTEANGYKVHPSLSELVGRGPQIDVKPGYENQVHAFNFYDYLARQDYVWMPAVCAKVKHNWLCASVEENDMPLTHKNDRIEWFLMLSDQIIWDIMDGESGTPRSRVVMKSGDVACMPADIRHFGRAVRRSLLLIWENADPSLPAKIAAGEAPAYPQVFA